MTITEEITIHAPATRVFDALADAAQRRQWWGGDRFQLTSMDNDLRVGGRWSMRFEAYGRNWRQPEGALSASGRTLPGIEARTPSDQRERPEQKVASHSGVQGVYTVIDRPHVLEFTWRPDWYENPSESLVRFEFREQDGATHVTLTHSGLETEADRTNHRGWPDILAWLRAHAEAN